MKYIQIGTLGNAKTVSIKKGLELLGKYIYNRKYFILIAQHTSKHSISVFRHMETLRETDVMPFMFHNESYPPQTFWFIEKTKESKYELNERWWNMSDEKWNTMIQAIMTKEIIMKQIATTCDFASTEHEFIEKRNMLLKAIKEYIDA